jgi:HEAT repeat protein
LIYRIPRRTYDDWLPLTTKPLVKKTVRVGLVVHYHLEPELEAKVKKLVAQLGSRNFAVRNAADHELRTIGGAAFEIIEQAAKSADPEVRARCKNILKIRETEEKLQSLMKNLCKPEQPPPKQPPPKR